MKIETKFDIGQIVYFLDWKSEEIQCPYCNGKGKLILKDQSGNESVYYCEKCNGIGTIQKNKGIIKSDKIIGVSCLAYLSILDNQKKETINYYLSSSPMVDYEENSIFQCEEDAKESLEQHDKENEIR